MSSRKRRRSQAFQEEEFHVDVEDAEKSTHESAANTDDGKDQAEKEREVWDLVREERFEIVEQLPLTLHRQLSLMRQLDEQSQSYIESLLPMLRDYISLRKELDPSTTKVQSTSPDPQDERSAPAPPANPSPPTFLLRQPSTSSAPMLLPVERTKQPRTSREHLSHIAWLSEELLRASQEKVNLAQATYDSTERHIRLLDLAIREQEASLSSTEGTIQLPDLTLPKSARNTHESHSNIIDSYNAIAAQANEDGMDDNEEESPLEKALAKIIASNLVINPKKHGEPDELYCYCNRLSFGEMIACDNPQCNLEWFHLGCVGLDEPPEGEWYCENCTRFDA